MQHVTGNWGNGVSEMQQQKLRMGKPAWSRVSNAEWRQSEVAADFRQCSCRRRYVGDDQPEFALDGGEDRRICKTLHSAVQLDHVLLPTNSHPDREGRGDELHSATCAIHSQMILSFPSLFCPRG